MAFPFISNISEFLVTSNTTTHNFTIPDYTVAGDLLILFCAVDATETISNMQSGWINLFTTAAGAGGTGHVWYRIADGTETDGSYTTGTNEVSVNRVYRIAAEDWDGYVPPESGNAYSNLTVSKNSP